MCTSHYIEERGQGPGGAAAAAAAAAAAVVARGGAAASPAAEEAAAAAAAAAAEAEEAKMSKGELAGHLKADKQRLKAKELSLLFSLEGDAGGGVGVGPGVDKLD